MNEWMNESQWAANWTTKGGGFVEDQGMSIATNKSVETEVNPYGKVINRNITYGMGTNEHLYEDR